MALTQTLERYVCEEVTEGDLNGNILSNPSQDKPNKMAGESSSLSKQMDVDASVKDLLSDAKEHRNGKQQEVEESVEDFLKTAISKQVNEIKGGKELIEEAIDNLSLLAHGWEARWPHG